MKKFLTIMLVAITAVMLSSCIIVTNNDPDPVPTYSFYFFNNSDYEVRDWYLLDKNDTPYYKNNDGYACKIESHEISKKSGLYRRTYRVYYEYYDSTKRLHTQYSNYFDLDTDVTYKFVEDSFYEGIPRSVKSVE